MPSAFASPATTQPTFAFTSLTTDWAYYDAKFLDATDATDAAKTMYYILADQTLANGEWIAVDEVMIYPASAPTLNGYLLVSEPDDPETFDYSYGIKGVRPGDGQAITNCAELRGVLFAFKERSTFAVIDNGQKPYQWADTLVSDSVGCISPHGVAKGDGWLVTLSPTERPCAPAVTALDGEVGDADRFKRQLFQQDRFPLRAGEEFEEFDARDVEDVHVQPVALQFGEHFRDEDRRHGERGAELLAREVAPDEVEEFHSGASAKS